MVIVDMLESLRYIDNRCQRHVDYRSSDGLRLRMAHTDEEKSALGKCLAAARKEAGFTIEGAAAALTQAGHNITKGAVGHWEKGTNLPDAIWLRRLARLYDTTVDALVHQAGREVAAWPFDGILTPKEWAGLEPAVRDKIRAGALFIAGQDLAEMRSGKSTSSQSGHDPRKAA